ncbi:MAG: hypothetical protein HGGPFJEG_03093 [Ignavibacteria bacterium]|nr:hypothetical protein [Ignavibacteria bacterium]
MAKDDIKQQDWFEFDKLMEEFGRSLITNPSHNLDIEIKRHIYGPDSMTDAQHKKIIALFTNELGWGSYHAFKFMLRTCPDIINRLRQQALTETDLRELYKVIKKKEASKIINVLSAISKRRKLKNRMMEFIKFS